jgi:hypothetical protein
MSKQAFLKAARSAPEVVTLSNGLQAEVRKFTQGEFESIIRATAKADEAVKGLAMQRKLVALTVTVEGEALSEQEVAAGIDNDLLRELSEHVSRVNGLNRKPEDTEGN